MVADREVSAVQEMHVVAVGLLPEVGRPVLLLQETSGQGRVLPVGVGLPEAAAIERERHHMSTPRPTTHHLILAVIQVCGRRLEQVRISVVSGAVLHAELVLDEDTRVSARVSDAVVLALHAGVPIECAPGVLDEAGVPGGLLAATTTGEADPQDEEVERFRRLLDTASPEDFGAS
jgi:bifunctional DNase/RNase